MTEVETGAVVAAETQPDRYADIGGFGPEIKQETPEEVKPEPEKVEGEIETEESNEGSEAKKKSKNGYKQKNERLAAELAHYKAELEKYQPKPQKTVEVPKTESEPSENDFDNVLDYLKAHQKWTAKQEAQALLTADKEAGAKTAFEQAQQAEYEEKVAVHREKMETFIEKQPDYVEKVSAVVEAGLVSRALEIAVLDCDNSTEVGYYLANNLNELTAIQKLPYDQMIRAVTKLDAKMESPTARVTKATPPISPVKTNAVTSTKLPIEGDQEDYEKWRLKK